MRRGALHSAREAHIVNRDDVYGRGRSVDFDEASTPRLFGTEPVQGTSQENNAVTGVLPVREGSGTDGLSPVSSASDGCSPGRCVQ